MLQPTGTVGASHTPILSSSSGCSLGAGAAVLYLCLDKRGCQTQRRARCSLCPQTPIFGMWAAVRRETSTWQGLVGLNNVCGGNQGALTLPLDPGSHKPWQEYGIHSLNFIICRSQC